MVAQILSTRDDEIACKECYEQLDRLAELLLDRKEPQETMSLVQDHLSRCGDCREEFEALLTALRALRKSSPDS